MKRGLIKAGAHFFWVTLYMHPGAIHFHSTLKPQSPAVFIMQASKVGWRRICGIQSASTCQAVPRISRIGVAGWHCVRTIKHFAPHTELLRNIVQFR